MYPKKCGDSQQHGPADALKVTCFALIIDSVVGLAIQVRLASPSSLVALGNQEGEVGVLVNS